MKDQFQLRSELEALIIEVLPQIWSNGDVRYLEKSLFNRILSNFLVIENVAQSRIKIVSEHTDKGVFRYLIYCGQFGVIYLKPTDHQSHNQ